MNRGLDKVCYPAGTRRRGHGPRLAFFALLGLFFFFVFHQAIVSGNEAAAFSTVRSSKSSAPFSLFATLTFTDIQYKEQFLRDIAPLADYIRQHEPDTISYNVLLSDQDPLKVLIMERYKDKDNAFLNVHRGSAPFQEFRPKLKAMQDAGRVEVDGSSYLDSTVGFSDRLAVEG